MSTQAVGTYLHLVRETVMHLSLENVAVSLSTALGMPVDAPQLRRIEQGQPTTTEILSAFTTVINGDMKHVTTLMAADAPMQAVIQSMVQVIRRQHDRG